MENLEELAEAIPETVTAQPMATESMAAESIAPEAMTAKPIAAQVSETIAQMPAKTAPARPESYASDIGDADLFF